MCPSPEWNQPGSSSIRKFDSAFLIVGYDCSRSAIKILHGFLKSFQFSILIISFKMPACLNTVVTRITVFNDEIAFFSVSIIPW